MQLSAKITPENFSNSFDLKTLLKNSVFYPASGVCGEAIKALSARYNSFVHVDYSTPQENVIQHLRNDFSEMLYLEGLFCPAVDFCQKILCIDDCFSTKSFRSYYYYYYLPN
jgi:hypothetical protein